MYICLISIIWLVFCNYYYYLFFHCISKNGTTCTYIYVDFLEIIYSSLESLFQRFYEDSQFFCGKLLDCFSLKAMSDFFVKLKLTFIMLLCVQYWLPSFVVYIIWPPHCFVLPMMMNCYIYIYVILVHIWETMNKKKISLEERSWDERRRGT